MFFSIFKCSPCCKKTVTQRPSYGDANYAKSLEVLRQTKVKSPDKIYNIIKANIRNFEPLTNIEKEYILNFTTIDQKIELILLYDTCMKVLINDLLYLVNIDNENISEKYRVEDYDKENIRAFFENRSGGGV